MVVRLNKYLKDKGFCSRRKADDFILKGYVKVDGVVVSELGTKIDDAVNKVEVDPNAEKEKNEYVYILLYKPLDFISSKNEEEGLTVFDIVPKVEGLTYAGRLDKDSEGLIILSNDGSFIYKITNPENEKEKEYEVTLDHDIPEASLNVMRKGVLLDGKMTKPAKVKKLSRNVYTITLTEGINRQVRRMAGKVHFNVVSLRRIRIGSISVGTLKSGEWRNLTKEEIESFDDCL